MGHQPSDRSKASASQTEHDLEVVGQTYENRFVNGVDTANGGVFIGNSDGPITHKHSEGVNYPTLNPPGPFGPFGGAQKNYILIYGDPESK